MSWKQVLLSALAALAIMVTWCRSAAAAGCGAEIDRLTQRLGPNSPTRPKPEGQAPATTESRGVPPEAASRVDGPNAATPAGRRAEALAALQAARAAAVQGDEQSCLAQVAKARSALQGR